MTTVFPALRVLAMLLTLLVLVSCAVPPKDSSAPAAPAGTDRVVVRGELSYLARIALPPDSVAVVELRDSADDRLVAQTQHNLGGRQVPIPFELTAPRADVPTDRASLLRGSIRSRGRLAWQAVPVAVPAGTLRLDAGTLTMNRYVPLESAATMLCGGRRAQVGWLRRDDRDELQLDLDGNRHPLRSTVTASGARYEAVDAPGVSVWFKGERATIDVPGEKWPECSAKGSFATFLRAGGNEPGWRLDIGEALRFSVGGTPAFAGPSPPPKTADGVRRYAATSSGRSIAVAISDRRCADNMTGMPHPHLVEVMLDGKTYRGCGGEPASLLRGPEWVVEDIGSSGIVDRSRATLNFGDDGRLFGRGSCNNFNAAYTLTGENLTIGQAASTMMACEEPLMQQERRFLDVLQQVTRFEISDSGALVLVDRNGRKITARR